MKFIQRLGYYLGGFAIGLVILVFFLNGKDASCDYGPNARTVKNISSKQIEYSGNIASILYNKGIDSTIVKQLIQFGNVNFSESDTKAKPCKEYKIENTYKKREVIMRIKNCSLIATIIDFKIKD